MLSVESVALLIFSACCSFVTSCPFYPLSLFGQLPLNDLRVTWTMGLGGFKRLPRTIEELKRDDRWTLRDGRDDQCKTSNMLSRKFLGIRYWFNEDPAVILLFDIKGTIAGIQTSIPNDRFTPSDHLKDKHYIEDGDYWTLTAYFVNPVTICGVVGGVGGGRDKQQLADEGTATGLWFQWDSFPTASTPVLLNEADMKNDDPNWKEGYCFYTMGKHYWYNVKKDMSCKEFVPNCIMYNKGKLTAFCFAVNADLKSTRYEHPTVQQASKFMNPVPTCFDDKDSGFQKLSTMHVYFISHPRTGSRC